MRSVPVVVLDILGQDRLLPELPGQVARLLSGPGSARVLAAGCEQDASASLMLVTVTLTG